MDIIQLDANVACHKRCSNCTRLVAHQNKRWEMTPAQVRDGIRSLNGWHEPGKVVGLIGGEVTLHTQFAEIARVFREEVNPHIQTRLRLPIADLNAFAQERLYDRTSGRGLWTSMGKGFWKHFETICDTFDHWNTNTHEVGGVHQALLIHRDDYCAKTGMSPERWEANRDACWVQNMWSASINDKGAYPCEVMASIDRLLYDGAHAWPAEPGWWRRTPEEFGDMLRLCDHCSLAQPGPGRVDALECDVVSEKNRLALPLSPAMTKGRYEMWNGETDRTVETRDSYVGGPRVVEEKQQKTLTAVVCCVGFWPLLGKTIHHNSALVDLLVVVTTSDDHVPKNLPENVMLVCTNDCYRGESAFNKGAMLNAALRAINRGHQRYHDWILFTDADIFLHPELKKWFQETTLNPGCLYYTQRLDIDSVGENGEAILKAPEDREPNGFFQLWNKNSIAMRERWPNVMSQNFCSAGGIDSWFMQQWPLDKRVYVECLTVAHIPHGGSVWNGTLPGQRWRQVGVLTQAGFSKIREIPKQGKQRLRLTDTKNGESVDIEVDFDKDDALIPPDVFRVATIFNGKDIGMNHVHVACLTE